MKEGEAFWLDMDIDLTAQSISGESRIEKPYKKYFAYKSISGKVLSDSSIHISEVNIQKKKEHTL